MSTLNVYIKCLHLMSALNVDIKYMIPKGFYCLCLGLRRNYKY